MAPADRKYAILTLSPRGLDLARRLARDLKAAVFVHRNAVRSGDEKTFESIAGLTAQIFRHYQGLVFIAPAGVAMRALAPHIEHKTSDPAVVVVDTGARWAVSLLSGHEGGANALTLEVAAVLGCRPVITTSSEAEKDIIVGVGCRKGISAARVVQAVDSCLGRAGLSRDRVRLMVSARLKINEQGLRQAARELGFGLCFLPETVLAMAPAGIEKSDFVREKTGLPGVAEPCALLGGHNTELILGKTICSGVTVALARENFILWE